MRGHGWLVFAIVGASTGCAGERSVPVRVIEVEVTGDCSLRSTSCDDALVSGYPQCSGRFDTVVPGMRELSVTSPYAPDEVELLLQVQASAPGGLWDRDRTPPAREEDHVLVRGDVAAVWPRYLERGDSPLYEITADGTVARLDPTHLVAQTEDELSFEYQVPVGDAVLTVHEVHRVQPLSMLDVEFEEQRCDCRIAAGSGGVSTAALIALGLAWACAGRRRRESSARRST